MTDLNDLLVTSPDLNRERLETLKNLFPDLFTDEGKFNSAELKRLFEEETTTDKEQYTFTWRGKARAKKHAFTPSRAALTYDPKRSVSPDKANGNMIIEGENLEALRVLTSAYREQVKCIYIDPPYNRDGDYIYLDNYTRDRREYWEENGSYQDGIKMDTNPETSGRYHSDWLSMMYSRLLVARQMLRDDGVILASIDDNEVHNLLKVMDEVFGEENFITKLTWEKGRKNDSTFFSESVDYILIFAKDKPTLSSKGVWRARKPRIDFIIDHYNKLREKHGSNHEKIEEEMREFYRGLDHGHPAKKLSHFNRSDDRGLYFGADISSASTSIPDYEIIHPVTKEPVKKPKRGWGATEEVMLQRIAEDRVLFGEDATTIPLKKSYLEEVDSIVNTPVIYKDGRAATLVIKSIFGSVVFDNPKDHHVLADLFSYVTKNSEGIFLDFFAGSGSTAHAVMKLNLENGGDRKFILIQLPESIREKHTAYKAGYRTISQITIERCKRVIEGYGDNPQPLDTGFKVYRLTKSHFPRADFQPDPDKSNEENVELLKQYIAEKEASFHMAFEQDQVFDEVLLKHGFKLNYKLTKQEGFGSNTLYLAEEDDKKAYICLDTSIASETIDFFKTHTDTTFICLERALDTTKKWNLNHTLGERLKAI